nr:MAG TPA: hypothetical protein [Caudoviricetes sp.]
MLANLRICNIKYNMSRHIVIKLLLYPAGGIWQTTQKNI